MNFLGVLTGLTSSAEFAALDVEFVDSFKFIPAEIK